MLSSKGMIAKSTGLAEHLLAVLGWLDELGDADYTVELYVVDGKRVYRAVDPETGERQQVHTVPGAVTDWVVARGVAMLMGLT